MNIQYLNPGFEYSIESILLFQSENESPYWMDSIFYFYPQLDKHKIIAMPSEEKRRHIAEILKTRYIEIEDELNARIVAYNAHWQKHRDQIEAALSEAFGLDARRLFNDLRGNITMNPVSPRFLRAHCFDLFYLNSERGAIGISIHEMIHFLWFHVWNQHFRDTYDEYERPSMKWILSEMVVESIMRDERLSSINPYFPRENGGCVYPYFQDMVVDGQYILETLDALYRENDIRAFMEKAYDHCTKHESAIRTHIEKSERQF